MTESSRHRDSADRLLATKELLTEIDSIYFDHMPNFTMTDFAEEPQKLVAATTALRQRESLQAAIILADGKLGHLGVSYVRPACDEYLWLAYLSQLESGDARDIVLSISFEETMRSVKAQRDHLGDEVMQQIGFPNQFLLAVEQLATKAKDRIGDLAVRLGWSKKGKRAPTMEWVATETQNESLYRFLHSATSRTLHFSPLESFRRAWSEVESDQGAINASSPIYINYRTDFALYWLPYLLIRTLMTPLVSSIIEGGNDHPEESDLNYEHHMSVVKKLGITWTSSHEELNLHKLKERTSGSRS